MGIGEFDVSDIGGTFKTVNLFTSPEDFKDVKLHTCHSLLRRESTSCPLIHIILSRVVFAVRACKMKSFARDLKRGEG